MKPKILIVSNLYPPTIVGGYEIACHDTVKVLEPYFDVTVATAFLPASGPGTDSKVHRIFKLFNYFGTSKREFPVQEVEEHNYSELNKLVTQLAPQLIYFWNTNGLGAKLLDVGKKHSIPALYHFMDESVLDCQMTLRRWVSLKLRRRKYPAFNYRGRIENAVFISNYIATKFEQIYQVKKSRTIYPYVDAGQIHQKREYLPRTDVTCVFVGQIEPHKGIYELCTSLKQYQEKTKTPIKLHVFGRSSCGLDERLKREFPELVEIKQGVQRQEILQNLHRYDVGFFPSKWEEPFGIAQLELMAAGLPVFSTGKGGSKEVLTGTNAIHFDLNDYPAFEEKFHRILQNYEAMGREIGINARQGIEQKFNPSIYQTSIREFINELLSPR